MTPKSYLEDADLTLYQGDALTVLRELPSESVHCCVTSPPFYGLRSYLPDGHEDKSLELGLEPTPEEWVAKLVEVFQEVRRILRADGTCWIEIGDSYAQAGGKQIEDQSSAHDQRRQARYEDDERYEHARGLAAWRDRGGRAANTAVAGLKQKDLIGAPWLLAFALRADGWYLRSEIIWHKSNPMPESTRDRPTTSHSRIFLLSKSARYFWDAEAVREKDAGLPSGNGFAGRQGGARSSAIDGGHGTDERFTPGSGRNIRSVWEIATEPYPEAHFATYPQELVRRCILAGCPEYVCSACYAPFVDEQHSKLAERPPAQEGVRRVREVLRGSRADVLQPELQHDGEESITGEDAACVSQLRAAHTEDAKQVLLAEVCRGVGDEDGGEPQAVPTGASSGELEGRQSHRCERVRQDLQPRATEVPIGASRGDGASTGPITRTRGDGASPERDQDGQPPGELGDHGAGTAPRNGGLPALRQDVRDPVSVCCSASRTAGTVLDCFAGSGTTGLVARKHGRRSILIELSEVYCELAARRTQQLSVLAEAGSA